MKHYTQNKIRAIKKPGVCAKAEIFFVRSPKITELNCMINTKQFVSF